MLKNKKFSVIMLVMVTAFGLMACSSTSTESTEIEKATVEGTLTIAAAASLEVVFTEQLIPMFNELYPDVTIEGTYDSSGKLQTQIEEGAAVDIFFSAAVKQMDALSEDGMIADDTIVELLENKIVMIVPTGKEDSFSSFEEIKNADIIAIGDPESVPAGQYAQETLTNLGLWEQVEGKLSLGTNVTEVLNWVAASSAEVGVVYATDAASMADQISVVAEAPEGGCSKVIYPVGMLADSQNPDAAKAFLAFLQTEEAAKVFEAAGFIMNN